MKWKDIKSQKYAVRYSAHGMAYLPLKPLKFNLSLEEAIEECKNWASYADTVGGDSIIVEKYPLVSDKPDFRLKPNKDAKVPEYDLITEGFDPNKLKNYVR